MFEATSMPMKTPYRIDANLLADECSQECGSDASRNGGKNDGDNSIILLGSHLDLVLMEYEHESLEDRGDKEQDADLERNFLTERIGEEQQGGDSAGVNRCQCQGQDYPRKIEVFPIHRPSPFLWDIQST